MAVDPAHVHLGDMEMSVGNVTAAQAIFEEAVRLEPSSLVGHDRLARLRRSDGRVLGAVPMHRRACRLAPLCPRRLQYGRWWGERGLGGAGSDRARMRVRRGVCDALRARSHCQEVWLRRCLLATTERGRVRWPQASAVRACVWC